MHDPTRPSTGQAGLAETEGGALSEDRPHVVGTDPKTSETERSAESPAGEPC